MSDAPARPKNVPPKAVWNPDEGEWELGARGPGGERTGVHRFWRRDGSLCHECSFKDGRPHGAFKRFHNNGEISQEGQFVEGRLHGLRTWYACDERTDEEALVRGLSEKVRRSQMEYLHGRVISVRHFDAQGDQVLPGGEPYPERPAMVPDEAEYQPDIGWVIAILDGEGRRDGTWQCWNEQGQLVERAEYVHDVRHGPTVHYHPNGRKSEEGAYEQGEREGVWRSFDAAGQPIREITWRSGSRNGPAVDRGVAGQYASEAVAVERGSFEDDHAVGQWSLQDASGRTVIRRDLGIRLDDGATERCEALADRGRPAEEWIALAEECRAGRRFAEALLAHARGVAAGGRVGPLLDALGEHALPRARDHAAGLARQAGGNGGAELPLPALVNLLMRGAAPAPVLRAIAVCLDQGNRRKSRAALDFVNAAILLDPEDTSLLFTRGLVLLSLGQPELALEDAAARAADDPEEGRFLETFARALFPRFDFWPAREKPWTDYDDLPEGPAQPGAKIRVAVLKYLTRLSLLREAQLERIRPGRNPGWLVPDVSRILPAGRVKLDRLSFELVDREGGQARRVEIDEGLQLDGMGLADLMRLARADWTALTWLCWGCGLKDVLIPKNVNPPKSFGEAAGMAAQRLWRLRDKKATGGAVAKKEGVPGFVWEGVDIDALHPGLVSMAEAEYAELAAMFRWLTDERQRSPWQDNLRDS